MESLKQIKKELHEYIDGISDEKELMLIYENIFRNLKSDSIENKVNGHLANYQIKKLDETIEHGTSDKIESEKEKSIARWFTDGGKNQY